LKRFNLRSSNLLNICFGAYVSRQRTLDNLLNDVVEPINPFAQKFINHGNLHEKSGVAKWILINKQMPTEILSEQKNYVVENFLNLKGDTLVDLSCTPDGRYNDVLLEIKCGAMGEKPHALDKMRIYLAQVCIQQYVLNSLGVEINKTHLVSWSFNGTRIWEVQRNVEFEHYLMSILEEFSIALIGSGDIEKKPKKFEGEHKIKLIYGEE
tara:strand:+ start:790 stop:1419 length:630 start_codon:yes stop_codon:yes gene_type:complete